MGVPKAPFMGVPKAPSYRLQAHSFGRQLSDTGGESLAAEAD